MLAWVEAALNDTVNTLMCTVQGYSAHNMGLLMLYSKPVGTECGHRSMFGFASVQQAEAAGG